jgi:hypothetical protein
MPLDKVAGLLDEGYAAVVKHKHEKTQRVFRMARQGFPDSEVVVTIHFARAGKVFRL